MGFNWQAANPFKDIKNLVKNPIGSTWHYLRDEGLGIDDWKAAAAHAKKGEWGKAIKSGATALGEEALSVATVASLGVVGAAKAGVVEGGKAVTRGAAKGGAKAAAVVAAEKQANNVANKAGSSFGSRQFKDKGGDDYFFPTSWKPPKPPLKPMPTGGGRAPTATAVREAPPATTFDPSKLKPFDPYNPAGKPNWGDPIAPGVKPKPYTPKPKTAPAKPKPATKPTTTTPWKPENKAVPDAAKPSVKTETSTSTKTQAQTKAQTKSTRVTNFANGLAVAAPIILRGKKEEGTDKPWYPSSLV